MIILKLNEETPVSKKESKRKSKKRKEQLFDYSRSGIVINNKPHFVISVSQNTLEDFEFQKLLSKYKGSIVASQNLENEPILNELLFDSKPFKKKALFESFKSTVFSKAYINYRVLICDFNFYLRSEIPGILPFVKSVTIATENVEASEVWKTECFLEYGVKPDIVHKDRIRYDAFDVVADFETIDDNKLQVNVLGEEVTFYPSFKYLEIPDELKILENFELSNTTICAAFKNF
ncbi:MAG: hypothetical protein E7557_00320 [Ruminococcaceae bacterium]|nr:hypothetical protein [Oscillospiraceae bacterium]